MKSIHEILKSNNLLVENSNNDGLISSSMQEYAEQESIAFAEWTSQTLKWQKKSKKDLWLNNETLSVVTTNELYHIFKITNENTSRKTKRTNRSNTEINS